jgi:hypothetical protein
VQFQNESLSNLKIKLKLQSQDAVVVDMSFKDKSSIFPTDIVIRRWKKGQSILEQEDQLDESSLDQEQILFFSKLKHDLTVRAMKDVFLDITQ